MIKDGLTSSHGMLHRNKMDVLKKIGCNYKPSPTSPKVNNLSYLFCLKFCASEDSEPEEDHSIYYYHVFVHLFLR